MEHRSSESIEWNPAPEEFFTGRAWFGDHHPPADESDLWVLGVRFEAGARTDWHTHPGGQVLYVLEGSARVQTADGEMVELGPGDALHAPAGEEHWHGAGPDGPMRHLSITHAGFTQWVGRKVTDDEYDGSAPDES